MAARRLLVVSDEMEIGGSQRQITLLLGGLDRTRWQPELLFFRERSFLIDELESLGVPIHCVPKRRRIQDRVNAVEIHNIDSGHTDESLERNIHGNVFEVVFCRPSNQQAWRFPVHLTSSPGKRDLLATGKIVECQARRI